jgi:uncharacterized membrane protein
MLLPWVAWVIKPVLAVEIAHSEPNMDFQINLLTEHEIARAIRMLDAIGHKLGINDNESDSERTQREQNVEPQSVLHEMDLAQRRML